MLGDRLSIAVPCKLRYRDAVGALIQNICQQLEQSGADQNLGFQVISAFNEAFNNVCQYAYTDRDHQEVEVVIELDETTLAIELKDHGKPFNMNDVESPDLNALPESGLGIFIIRSFMNNVDYQPGQNQKRNVLRMARKLKASEPNQGTNHDA